MIPTKGIFLLHVLQVKCGTCVPVFYFLHLLRNFALINVLPKLWQIDIFQEPYKLRLKNIHTLWHCGVYVCRVYEAEHTTHLHFSRQDNTENMTKKTKICYVLHMEILKFENLMLWQDVSLTFWLLYQILSWGKSWWRKEFIQSRSVA